MTQLRSILLIGCGNMGGAMLTGWLAAGMDPATFTIVDPVLAETPGGVTLLRAMPEGQFDAILLGVKPQLFGEVAPGIAPLAGPGSIVLSILAGIELSSLALRFPYAKGLVRIMPNLAASIGKSPIALAQRGLGEADITRITALMSPLGTPEWFDEGQFDAVTALAGSGPAFVYRFLDALAQGAAALGMAPDQAQRLALAMVEGAGALASASEHAPGELARRVASPGGTTQAGLDVLDAESALARLVAATLKAAADRSAEMAAAARD
jgi:pyrroline-5-carboxylate reductase